MIGLLCFVLAGGVAVGWRHAQRRGVTAVGGGNFTLTAHSVSDLNGLTITPASEFEGTVTVGVSAVTHDGIAVSAAGTTLTTLIVDPVADQPVVTASASEINEDGTSNLTIGLSNAASLFENLDDSVTVTVSLDNGATLYGTGVSSLGGGVFTLTATSTADLNGLTITPASEFEGSVHVGVSAITHDGTAVSSRALVLIGGEVPTINGAQNKTGQFCP
jgi:hypothetical protein